MTAHPDETNENKIALAEEFLASLDQLKNLTDTDYKINDVIPSALKKLENGTPDDQAKGQAILETLSEDTDQGVKRATIAAAGNWANFDEATAQKNIIQIASNADKKTKLLIAERITQWADAHPELAGSVASALADDESEGVLLALAEGLGNWAESNPEAAGIVAKKIATTTAHYNAAENMMKKTYGKNWRTDLFHNPNFEEGPNYRLDEAIIRAKDYICDTQAALARNLGDLAKHNPEPALETIEILAKEAKKNRESSEEKKYSELWDALKDGLSTMAEESPESASRAAALIVKDNSSAYFSNHKMLDVLEQHPTVNPRPTYETLLASSKPTEGRERAKQLTTAFETQFREDLTKTLEI